MSALDIGLIIFLVIIVAGGVGGMAWVVLNEKRDDPTE